MGARIRLSDVSASFGETEILRQLNLEVVAGEFVTLVGRSGCGKSTLLRVIGGLHQESGLTTNGCVELSGSDRQSPVIGMVFQRSCLLPFMNVRDNIRLQSKLHANQMIDHSLDEMLERVGLTEQAKKYPHELSGGMQQRVALAREFIRRPDLLLLDEPFSNLDRVTKEQMYTLLFELLDMNQLTIVMVTHDPDEAVYLSDRVMVMSNQTLDQSGELSIDLPRPRQPKLREEELFPKSVTWILDQLSTSA